MWNNLKIAISGKSGCGNSTVGRLVAEKLGLKLINYTFKNMAKEQGLDFSAFHKLAERDDRYDRELDRKQLELAQGGNCVLSSRLALWLLKDAQLKVYLQASLETRAARIQRREGGSLQGVLEKTEARDSSDRERYLNLYNIDNNQYGFADMVIDTNSLTADQIADRIVEAVRGLKPKT